jgi:hypothetical protein
MHFGWTMVVDYAALAATFAKNPGWTAPICVLARQLEPLAAALSAQQAGSFLVILEAFRHPQSLEQKQSNERKKAALRQAIPALGTASLEWLMETRSSCADAPGLVAPSICRLEPGRGFSGLGVQAEFAFGCPGQRTCGSCPHACFKARAFSCQASSGVSCRACFMRVSAWLRERIQTAGSYARLPRH